MYYNYLRQKALAKEKQLVKAAYGTFPVKREEKTL